MRYDSSTIWTFTVMKTLHSSKYHYNTDKEPAQSRIHTGLGDATQRKTTHGAARQRAAPDPV